MMVVKGKDVTNVTKKFESALGPYPAITNDGVSRMQRRIYRGTFFRQSSTLLQNACDRGRKATKEAEKELREGKGSKTSPEKQSGLGNGARKDQRVCK
jgi:hypothetical protein